MKYPNLEAERARRGMTQSDLSALLGVSPKTYQNWQTGKTELPTSKLCKLADIFKTTTDYLLGRY